MVPRHPLERKRHRSYDRKIIGPSDIRLSSGAAFIVRDGPSASTPARRAGGIRIGTVRYSYWNFEATVPPYEYEYEPNILV